VGEVVKVVKNSLLYGAAYTAPRSLSNELNSHAASSVLASSKLREAAMVSLDEFIVWIVIGLLGGSLAGLIITRERKGFGLLRNLGLGLAGAIVGGLLFRLLGLFPELDKVTISLRDVVAAVIGSLLILGVLWLVQRYRRSPSG
jgi:uncharacterized membrane protein YeaQ/YmgE (transglycosylase-associated protein family)